MTQEILRHELKYRIARSDSLPFVQDISTHCLADSNAGESASYQVSSIYFDTNDLKFYWDRKESRRYRRKLRLRAYSVGAEITAVFLEIKEKMGKLVNKKRVLFPKDETAFAQKRVSDFDLNSLIKDYPNDAVCREINYLHKYLHLNPVLLVRFDRMAFSAVAESNLRITLDANISAAGNSLLKSTGQGETLTLPKEEVILEVKCERNVPYWLTQVLNKYKFHRFSYSKYCMAVDSLKILSKDSQQQQTY